MERIKCELGPGAVILSTRNFRENGQKLCEITAGVDQSAPVRRPAAAEKAAAPSARPAAAGGGKGPDACGAPGGAADDLSAAPAFGGTGGTGGPGEAPGDAPVGWARWHEEWTSLKGHLLAFMKPQMDLSALSPRQRLAMEHLEREGVSDDVLLRLFHALKDDPKASVLAPLARLATARPWCARNHGAAFQAVAGPHGVGRTTALLRMALALKAENPALRVCLVTADARGGARSQLKRYADLCDFAYREISNPVECAALARERPEFDRVLVDLPCPGRGERLEDALGRLGLARIPDLAVHLVLAPYFSPQQYAAFADQYHCAALASLIWTKLDETCTFGALVNVAADLGLPVSAVSCGPGLKNTLAPADAATLWRALFKHELPGDAEGGRQAA
jgi:flagellar biosynthesis protein FlhF